MDYDGEMIHITGWDIAAVTPGPVGTDLTLVLGNL